MAAAMVVVDPGVARDEVVAGRETQQTAGAVDQARGTLEFEENADGGLVQLDRQTRQTRDAVGFAVLFIPEARDQPDGGKNSGQACRVGDGGFDFLADFVAGGGGSRMA